MGSRGIVRIVLAKPGLDGHDRGVKVIARALRDAGMEVIYTGLRQTPEKIATAIEQEDADVLMLSIHSGAHKYIFPRVMQELKERGIDDIVVLAGGIIPEEDIPGLKTLGIKEVFGPGTNLKTIIDAVTMHVDRK